MVEKSVLLRSFALLFLTACQTGPDILPFEQRIQSWQGARFNELVQAWGLPLRQSFETEQGYAEWQNSQVKQGPSISIGIGGYGDHVSGRIGTTIHGEASQQRCVIQVQFDKKQQAISITHTGPKELCDPLVPVRY